MNQTQLGSYENIPLAAIRPSSTNPRKNFDQAALEELAQSIGELGVTVPVLVRPIEPNATTDFGTYELVSGERRYRAAQMAGLTEIPATIKELKDAEAAELQMVAAEQAKRKKEAAKKFGTKRAPVMDGKSMAAGAGSEGMEA